MRSKNTVFLKFDLKKRVRKKTTLLGLQKKQSIIDINNNFIINFPTDVPVSAKLEFNKFLQILQCADDKYLSLFTDYSMFLFLMKRNHRACCHQTIFNHRK